MTAKKITFQQIIIKVEPDLDKKNLRHGNKPVCADDSDVIVISSDLELEKQTRVKKEDFRVKVEGVVKKTPICIDVDSL
jgi:hypothetical protein